MKIFFNLTLIILLLIPNFTLALSGVVLINEIAWMGTGVSANDEWIELYNNSSEDVLIDGWVLKTRDGQPEILLSGTILANQYYLLERTDDDTVISESADLIYSGSLGNTGEYLELFDENNILIDFVNMSSGWEHGSNENKNTMERVDIDTWQTSLSIEGSPKNKNLITEVNNNDLETTETQNSENVVQKSNDYAYSDVLINEIVSDPADSEEEWIEIYNNSGKAIELDNWYIKDGSGAKTILEGTINSNEYIVIGSPKGNLNNSGDEVLLFSSSNFLINKVAYGNWDDGNLSDNAPYATDPFSLSRINNQDSGSNLKDFAITKEKTKGGVNIIYVENVYNNENSAQSIVVSEVYPNPVGDEKLGEYIELYNYGDKDISLFGWRIGDDSKTRFEFKREDKIKSKDFLVIHRKDSNIALNNTGDTVNVYKAGSEEALYSLVFSSAKEGSSFNNTKIEEIENFYNKEFSETDWLWSDVLTPGEKNKFQLINHAPEVDFSFPEKVYLGVPIIFDSSDSNDLDGDELKYKWDFGDGIGNTLPEPEHTYFKTGIYKVSLEVSDGEHFSIKDKSIKVENKFEIGKQDNIDFDNILNFGDTKIFITEILPNPDGDDLEGEFIEIYNASDFEMNLIDWILDDMEGGSKPYRFASDFILNSGSYHVLNRTDSGVVLNNSFDKVRLINSSNVIVDELEYKSTKNNKSYSKQSDGNWEWTENMSPGFENQNALYNQDEEDKIEIMSSEPQYSGLKTPAEAQNIETGQNIIVEGVVNSLPGTFSTQYFYIEGDGGIQVYSFYKDFPELKIGDLVQVRAEVSKINSENRLKTKTKDEIVVVDRDYTLTINELKTEMGSEHLGKVFFVSGTVVEKSNNKIILNNEFANFEVDIKEGGNIDKKNIKVGDKLKINGVVVSTKSSYNLLPRFGPDIELLEDQNNIGDGRILGEYAQAKEWTIEKKETKNNYYIFLLLVVLISVPVIILYKRKPRS